MALLAYANRIFPGNVTMTGNGTWATDLPLVNLMDRRLGKVARQLTGGPNVTLGFDFGAPKWHRVIGLLGCNRRSWDPAANEAATYIEIEVKLSNVAVGNSEIWNSGVLGIGDAGINELERGVILPLPQRYQARYMQVRTLWDAPIGESWRQAGVAWISDAIEFGGATEKGVDRDWWLDHIDPSLVRRSRSQTTYTDARLRYRRLTAKSTLEDEGAMFGSYVGSFLNSIQGALIRNGGSREVILIPRVPADTWSTLVNPGWQARQFIQRTAVYGLMPSETRIQHRSGPHYDAPSLVVTSCR